MERSLCTKTKTDPHFRCWRLGRSDDEKVAQIRRRLYRNGDNIGGEEEEEDLEHALVEAICNVGEGVKMCRFAAWIRIRQQIWSPVIFVFFSSAILVLKKRGWWFKGRRESRWEAAGSAAKEDDADKKEKKVKFA